MATIIVTDGEQRSALAVVRSLGRAGHRVVVCAARPHAIACVSRYASSSHIVPDVLHEPDRFTDAIAELSESFPADVLLPVTDASLLALLPRRQVIAARIPFPDIDIFRRICDKSAVLERARRLGINTPSQVLLEHPERAADIPGIRFPLVVKPARSVVTRPTGHIRTSVTYARDPEDLARIIGDIPRDAYPVLLQQRVVGPGVGVFLILWNGRVMAAMAHRRIREKPPSGGVSVYRETVPLSEALLAQSAELLRSMCWSGPAMVEYKVAAETTEQYLMEVNGRFWGSLQLGIDSGVDFPAILVDLALGRERAPVLESATGVRSRWFWGDVDQLLATLAKPATELHLPPGQPRRRMRAILDFLTTFGPRTRGEVLRWSDPAPGIWETVNWIRRK